ncbi:foldase protein PrsA [Paenibacillus sp. 1_12]|uniref:foldase protein PrsA n=1 Tax=Paenibacillus sp. 1_12 TaxID=1566278 RepID=UPI0008E03367|nr:peptidylprolyl isomerase [Paenibacillus sp. 1_12]SFL23243.1 foldase protein PrsA [Paenibacillus sp. 1_12]
MTKKANFKWIISILLLLVVFITYVFLYPPVSKGESIAKVNGISIAKEQLYNAVMEADGKKALQNLIDQELIQQEAQKAGVHVEQTEIDSALESTKGQFSTEDEFNQALDNYGMTLASLKQNLQTQLTIEKILEPQVTVTDDEIKKYYDENLETLKTPEQVKASHILVATKEEAEAILQELKNGGDFSAIAQEKSLDTATKSQGGDLNYFAKGEMEEPFETAAFKLEIGALSDVIQSTNGFHIIKVADHKQAYTPTLEEKKEEIRKTVTKEKISTLATSWLEEKKSGASIENYLTS